MAPRVARSSIPVIAPKNAKNKSRKRNLDAYAIASHSAPEKTKIRQNRLGEFLDDEPRQKRRRVVEQGDDEESVEEDVPARRKNSKAQDEDIEYGSDSSGNEWMLGGLAENEDDSDLDSDEAFGESDEEKFEGFTFRGSSSGKKPVKPRQAASKSAQDQHDIDLDEADSTDEDEDDFGDEGVDLAAMLDDDDDEMLGEKDTTGKDLGEESPSEGEEEGSEEDSDANSESYDEEEDDDAIDEERVARMRDRLDAMDENQVAAAKPDSAQLASLSVEDLLVDLDPATRKQFSSALKTKKKSERPKTLSAPLPKRQQDRLDREVASKKAKEQLDRWRDTVIQSRRADHLSFPLVHPDEAEPMGKNKFVDSKPQNELEANIRKIMEESGMASEKPGDDAEENVVLRAEELAEKNIPVEEVMRRRAELRRARELLFREEIKAKRISKIKSKAYRRVHRREKQRERELLAGSGELDEDEQEIADRRRAEERMGAKHKDSKWARSLKASNRTVWDEGTRESIQDEAWRKEELKRRIRGENVDDGQESDELSDGDVDSDDDGGAQVMTQLDRLQQTGKGSKGGNALANMKFMRAAEAQKRARNDEDIERLRKELAIEDGDEEDEEENAMEDEGLGRAIFGPVSKQRQEPGKKVKPPEMEEGDVSDDAEEDEAEDVEIKVDAPEAHPKKPRNGILKKTSRSSGPLSGGTKLGQPAREELNAPDKSIYSSSWLAGPTKKSKKDQQRERKMNDRALIDTSTSAPEPAKKAAKPKATINGADAENTDGWTLVTHKNGDGEDEEADSDAEPSNPMLTAQQRNAELHHRAFAGDDVQAAFDAEKAELAASEDEKEVSNHLPGWGSWTGDGLSKSIKRANAKARHNPLYKTKLPGVRKEDRTDAHLENVIISQKGDRKGKKYLADLLPHGYEKREQYERSLRIPVGPEWTTSETFQKSTKPRVMVKRGVAVMPMERPLL